MTDQTGRVQLGILGVLEARRGGRRLPLGPYKQRVVLALLLCRANRVVSTAALREALWNDEPPRTAAKNIQVYVSALRKVLGPEPGGGGGVPIAHVPPGYLIEVGPDQLDVLRFRDLVRAGRRAAGDRDEAAAAGNLGEALRLWRGRVLPDLLAVPAVADEMRRLEEERLAAYEDWAEAMLTVGRGAEVLEGVGRLARRHPFRERLRRAQMLALHGCGRVTEALAEFDGLRQALARDLGLAPSPVLAGVYEAMLAGNLGTAAPAATATATTASPGRAGERAAAGRDRIGRDLADFTGRSGQLRELTKLLDGGRPAVLSGSAGVGKTALAVHYAHLHADRYPDGRILIPARADGGGGADPFGPGLLAALGGGRGSGASAASADAIRAATGGRRMLIILDGAICEQRTRPVLAAIGPSCDVVVTARRHLAGLESAAHVAVEPMPESEALDLLGRLIGTERIEAEPAAARRLLAVTGRLPLPIRIVGARLAGLRHLDLTRYAERLADERRVLDELSAGDLRVRPRLDEAYLELTAEERAALGRLAGAPDGPIAADEAARLLDGASTGLPELVLERLVEAHVVEACTLTDVEDLEDVADGTQDTNDAADAGRFCDVQAHHLGPEAPGFRVPPLIRAYVRERARR
jgi:DNA-binding SARP family transcriptional activator